MPVPVHVVQRQPAYPDIVNYKKCMPCLVGENPLDLLDKRVVAASFALVGALAVFVDVVISRADPYHTFILGSLAVYLAYPALNYMLTRYSDRYRDIGDTNKQYYVLSNVIKSTLLASFTPFCCQLLYDCLICDVWDNTRIRNLGSLYAICDFVSLLVVRRMASTTILHHVCVVMFNAFSLRNDYERENVCRLIMVYAIFSTYAYLVNMLLASRFMRISDQLSAFLSYAALVIYVLECGINWVWQAYYIRRLLTVNPHFSLYVYIFLICFVVYDDIVLNKWLCQNAEHMKRRTSQDAKQD